MTVADPTKLKVVKDLVFPGIFFGVTRVPRTERLFLGSSDFKVYEIDVAAEKPQPVAFAGEPHGSYVTGVALAGDVVVSGSYDGHLIWWDAVTRKQIRLVEAHDKWIRRVVSSPDGKTIASVADDMVCKLWNAESGELLRSVSDHQPMTPHHYPSMLYAVAISANGNLLATGDKVGHVAVWELATGKKLGEFETPGMYTWDPKQRRHSIGGIRSLAFTHDSKLLAVGGIGKIGNIDHLGGPSRIEIFDWKAKKRLHEISDEKFKGLIEQMTFHPSDEWFVAAGGDHKGFVSIYNAKTGKLIKQERAGDHVHGFAVNESFDRLYTVHHGRIMVWDLKPDRPGPAVAPKPA